MPFRFAAAGPGRWGGWGERRHLGSRQRVGVVYSMWEGGCTRVLGGRGRHSPSSAIVTAQEAPSGALNMKLLRMFPNNKIMAHGSSDAPEPG